MLAGATLGPIEIFYRFFAEIDGQSVLHVSIDGSPIT